MISFDQISVGETYDRPTLAGLWNYRTYNAISRGVVTPADKKLVVLFVSSDINSDPLAT